MRRWRRWRLWRLRQQSRLALVPVEQVQAHLVASGRARRHNRVALLLVPRRNGWF